MIFLNLLKWDMFRLLRTVLIGLIVAVLSVAAILLLENTGTYVAVAAMGGSGYCIVRSLYAVVIDLRARSASLTRTIQAPGGVVMLSKVLCASLVSVAMLPVFILSMLALGFHMAGEYLTFITNFQKWQWIWQAFEEFPFKEGILLVVMLGVLVSFTYVLAGSVPGLRRIRMISSIVLTVLCLGLLVSMPGYGAGMVAGVTVAAFAGLVLLYQFLYDAT